jgi:hypothetical protein
MTQKAPRLVLTTATDMGPGDCKYVVYVDNIDHRDLTRRGKYVLSNDKSTQPKGFSKSPRLSMVYRHLVSHPGPGQ